jgi:hypothetical protein
VFDVGREPSGCCDLRGLLIWSESYERALKDAFQVQDDIAQSIASALSLALAGATHGVVGRTTNPEAHDLVLRGRYQLNPLHRVIAAAGSILLRERDQSRFYIRRRFGGVGFAQAVYDRVVTEPA